MVRVQSRNGCALRSEGTPCVAQRVCAMPHVPARGAARRASASTCTLPLRFMRASVPSGPTTAMPAES